MEMVGNYTISACKGCREVREEGMTIRAVKHATDHIEHCSMMDICPHDLELREDV